jgi:hypothetical protein
VGQVHLPHPNLAQLRGDAVLGERLPNHLQTHPRRGDPPTSLRSARDGGAHAPRLVDDAAVAEGATDEVSHCWGSQRAYGIAAPRSLLIDELT